MRMMTRAVTTVLLMPFALTVALVGGPAAAQDIKGDNELAEHGQKIDKAASAGDSAQVTKRIVTDWKGTTFKFSPTDSHQLTATDVGNLRQKGLGFGGISILVALAGKQTAANPKSVTDILAMRQAGEGWGKIAKDLGYKNLGSVLKSVKATEQGVERVAKADDKHPDKVGKPEKVERIDKPERPAKPGR